VFKSKPCIVMKRFYYLFVALILAAAGVAQAQIDLNYVVGGFSQPTGNTYTSIATTGTVINANGNDDTTVTQLPIGFTFAYNGRNFTQFAFNTNGFIRLGRGGITRQYSSNLQVPRVSPLHASADSNLILPFNFDLKPGTAASTYHYQTSGTAPNRILTVQWRNVSDKDSAAPAFIKAYTNMEFQAKLYETTNVIEFAYGTFVTNPDATGTNFKSAGVGLKGTPGNRRGSVLYLQKSSTASWAATAAFKDSLETLTHFNFRRIPIPASGFTFRFTPAVLNDLEVLQIFARGSEAVSLTTPTVYKAVLRNQGAAPITNRVITLRITGANTFTTTATIANLAVSAIDSVSFPAWSPTANGINLIEAFAAPDQNTANDTAFYLTTTTPNIVGQAIPDPDFSTGSVGYGTGQGLLLARYKLTVAGEARAVRVFLPGGAATLGQKIFGVATNLAGNILQRSDTITIASADTNAFRTLTFRTPLNVNANADFLVGIGQLNTARPGIAYFPVSTQNEIFARRSQFFTAALGGGTPSPANTFGMFMIDAVVGISTINNDVSVQQIATVGDYPLGRVANPEVSVSLRNNGTQNLTNLIVTLALSGANTSSQTLTLPAFRSGRDTTVLVTLTGITTAGATTLTVSVPVDQVTTNNSRTWPIIVNGTGLFGYADNSPSSNSVGFGSTAGFVLGISGAVSSASPSFVNEVQVFIANTATLAGSTFFARLMRVNGLNADTVARSANRVLTVADLGTYVTFPFSGGGPFTTGQQFVVGLAKDNGRPASFPVGTQTENPTRRSIFWSTGPTGGLLDDVGAFNLGRYMIKANVVPATATRPTLAGTSLTLYPNPTGGGSEVRLAHSIARGTEITVRVFNILGSQVHSTTQASNGYDMALDLKAQPKGVYLVKVQANGAEQVMRLVIE
jgi:trimeric autotransporter adhesin